jgi:hypothetical protein
MLVVAVPMSRAVPTARITLALTGAFAMVVAVSAFYSEILISV